MGQPGLPLIRREMYIQGGAKETPHFGFKLDQVASYKTIQMVNGGFLDRKWREIRK